jgi:hypothetical protein
MGFMGWFVIIFGVIVVILVILALRRPKSEKMTSPSSNRAVVDADEAKLEPYPYIMVNDDGSVRELHARERKILETPFLPFDGGRPYTKSSYSQTDPAGKIGGYLLRKKLPAGTPIQPAPADNTDLPT